MSLIILTFIGALGVFGGNFLFHFLYHTNGIAITKIKHQTISNVNIDFLEFHIGNSLYVICKKFAVEGLSYVLCYKFFVPFWFILMAKKGTCWHPTD